MFEFDQFQREVLGAYLHKRAAGELPSQLVTLKRANLRDYIRGRVARGYDKRDEAVLKEYFCPDNEHASLDESIRQFDIEKFRPLINYLKRETANTAENNIKLLAWLIDFEPRPYSKWVREHNQVEKGNNIPDSSEVDGGSSTIEEVAGSIREEEEADQEVSGGSSEVEDRRNTQSEPPASKPNQKRIRIIAIVIVAVLSVTGLFVLTSYEAKHYMYWDGQKFIATSFKEEYSGIDLVPLNKHKLNNFRKIMRPDTLSQDDEKKVWYSKIDKHVEFFTMPGFHPVKKDRSLKAATKEILDKYAGDNASPIK